MPEQVENPTMGKQVVSAEWNGMNAVLVEFLKYAVIEPSIIRFIGHTDTKLTMINILDDV